MDPYGRPLSAVLYGELENRIKEKIDSATDRKYGQNPRTAKNIKHEKAGSLFFLELE